MDGSHVALVTLHLAPEGFEYYKADTNQVLGLSVQSLAKVMKLANPDDSITLQAVDKENYLKLTFENGAQEKRTEFNLNLISLDVEHLAIPETEYNSLVSLSATEFTKICRELFQLNETLEIKTAKDFVQFSVESDVGSGSIKLGATSGQTPEEKTNIEVTEGVTLQFALRYLNMFNKAAPLTTWTRLRMH